MREHLPALVFLIPLITAISLPLVGLNHRDWCRPLALGAIVVMVVLAVANAISVFTYGAIHYAFSGWVPPIGIEWVADGLSSVMMMALTLLALIILIYGRTISPANLGGRVVYYYTLILLLISALTGIVFAGDLFNIFVFLEVAALSSYGLVGMAGGRALVAAFRYLILGTLAASLYLLGVSYFYAVTGTLNMADIADKIPSLLTSKAVVVGLLFMFIGLGIKMALVPLHAWLPDAYALAPDSVSPILASLVTKVALLGWIRIIFWVLGADTIVYHVPLLFLVGWLGIIAAVIGAFLALTQDNVKRMFAYGGISHVGLILIGIGQGNRTGFAGGIFYLLNDAVMQATLFCLAGVAVCYYGIRTIEDLKRLRGQAPIMIGALIVMAMSMIGLPPTGGFFGKWYIILGAIDEGNYLAVGAVLASTLLTMGYFIKIFERVFRDQQPSGPVVEIPFSLKFSVGSLSAASIILGVLSDYIVGLLLENTLPKDL